MDKIDGEQADGCTDVKMESELKDYQIWAVGATVASMASVASMIWMAEGGTDVEVPLVLVVVASNGWRRCLASMVGWGLRHTGH